MKFLTILLAIFSLNIFAHGGKSCESHLLPEDGTPGGKNPGKQMIVDGGMPPEDYKKLEYAIKEVARVAHKLGYYTPDHVLMHGPSNELALQVANGGHAAPHWIDGQQVFAATQNSNSVLEFVTDGCPACHSYYQATTPLMSQISIYMHVAGHNDFSKASLFQQIRVPSNTTPASREMAEFMEELRTHAPDWDEVTKYYQLLQSLKMDQDVVIGTYQHSDEIAKILSQKRATGQAHAPIASVLQSVVASLPKDYPAWKLKMIKIFENREAWLGGAAQTKTINEGWATFSQHLIAKHSEWKKYPDLVDFQKLLSGVLGTSQNNPMQMMDNPYWMGTHMWFNIYDQFRALPEIKAMTDELAIDQAFVKHAHEIIGTHNDQEFLMRGITKEWVQKYKYLMIKRVEQGDPEFDPSKLPSPEHSMIQIVSNDFERIRRYIARKYADKGAYWARILYVDENRAGQYTLLKHDSVQNRDTPLLLDHAAAKLFVMTQILEKPVAIDTVVPKAALQMGNMNEYYANAQMIFQQKAQLEQYNQQARMFGWEEREVPDMLEGMATVRIVVAPNGDTKVLINQQTAHEITKGEVGNQTSMEFDVEHPNYTAWLQANVNEYKMDLDANFHNKFNYYENKKFQSLLSTFASKYVEASMPLVTSAPTAGAAMEEYLKFIKTRAARTIELALQGKIDVQSGAKGVQLNVLPIIPQFLLDNRFQKLTEMTLPKPVVDGQGDYAHPAADDRGILVAMEGLPGDVMIVPPNPPGKGGEGEGEGKPEDGEAEDGEPGDEPGEAGGGEGNDPHIVEIPWDEWLEMLNEKLELRNIRQTKGRQKRTESVRAGSKTVDLEPYRHVENVKKAYANGVNILLEQGKTELEIEMMNEEDIVELGWQLLSRDKLVSYNWAEVQVPDFDAVMVFAIDLSASMHGEPTERAKMAFYNIEHFLRKAFPTLEIRYIAFDTNAHEVGEKEIWNLQLGGGTSYAEGYKLAINILNEYSPSKFNRYFYFAGDDGDFSANAAEETAQYLAELHKMTESMGYFRTGSWGVPAHEQALKQAANDLENFDYAEWTEANGSMIDVIKTFFGPKQ